MFLLASQRACLFWSPNDSICVNEIALHVHPIKINIIIIILCILPLTQCPPCIRYSRSQWQTQKLRHVEHSAFLSLHTLYVFQNIPSRSVRKKASYLKSFQKFMIWYNFATTVEIKAPLNFFSKVVWNVFHYKSTLQPL